MHHPGPPRFISVGETVNLAPRDPDPVATYTWELVEYPEESATELGEKPVEQFAPDVPGTYVAGLSAPDGDHELTIRVFPGEQSPTGATGAGAGRSGRSNRSGRSGLSERTDKRGLSGRSGRSGYSAGESSREATTAVGDEEGAGGRPRLTLETVVEGDEVVVVADPEPHPGGPETAANLDVEFLFDDRADVDHSVATVDDRSLRLPAEAVQDRVRVHAVAVGKHGYSVPDAVTLSRQSGSDSQAAGGASGEMAGNDSTDGDEDVVTTRPYDPPAWATDTFIYEIYVRSFGEDDESPFDAIRDKLDYVESLGVDTIWLTPILENDHAPHGYNITDFFAVASDLGTRDDYERLVEAAHDRGLTVLFDVVCNHSARTHPYFQDAVGNPDSEYRDWYEWQTETEPETYFEWEHIANFNFDNLRVRRHLLDAFDHWLGLVDGFRCDMAWAVPDSFWRELHDRCKDHDSEFLLLDETIPYIPDYQAGLFDVHFDSTTYFTLRQIGHGQDADTVLDAVESRKEAGFPDHSGFMLYSENHDESRYIADCGRAAAEAAMGAVFTLPGAPMVYAGQEFGQRGRRDDLAWDHADDALREHVRRLSQARREQPALSSGATVSEAEYEVRGGTADRVTAYEMSARDESAVVVLNFGTEPATVSVPAAGRIDAVSGESVAADDAMSSVVVKSTVVLLRQGDGETGT